MKPFTLFLLYAFFLSCTNNEKKQYAIKDFDEKLQPALNKIIASGALNIDYASQLYVEKNIDKASLKKLSRSEHPILRALALCTILKDSTLKQPDYIFQCMSDTAMIFYDYGEFGIQYNTVSDYTLWEYLIKHRQMEDTLTCEAILKHNYLQFSYNNLFKIKTEEKYYASIKEMAIRDKPYGKNRDIENALYALASYKKKDDIPFIKLKLLQIRPDLSETGFNLMRNFPDTTYIEVLEAYYPKTFHRKIFEERNTDRAYSYIYALRAYDNPKCKAILKSIFEDKSFEKFYSKQGRQLQQQIDSLQNYHAPEEEFIEVDSLPESSITKTAF